MNGTPPFQPSPTTYQTQRDMAGRDINVLAAFLDDYQRQQGDLPPDQNALYAEWGKSRPLQPIPIDPFDNDRYGYTKVKGGYLLWSAGRDGKVNTADDLIYDSRAGRISSNSE